MVDIIYNNNNIIYKEVIYDLLSVEILAENLVSISICNDLVNESIGLITNETTINDVIQTSAQMIYDTLPSNV